MGEVVELKKYQSEEDEIRLGWGVWREPPVCLDFSNEQRYWDMLREQEKVLVIEDLIDFREEHDKARTEKEKWAVIVDFANKIREIFE